MFEVLRFWGFLGFFWAPSAHPPLLTELEFKTGKKPQNLKFFLGFEIQVFSPKKPQNLKTEKKPIRSRLL